MLVAASLALALVPALAYAQADTATTVVTDGAQTVVIPTGLPQQFTTRTLIINAPIDQISSYVHAIPSSVQVVASQPDGGFVSINLNGFSASVFIPATASIPTGVPLSPITPIFVSAPALSAASESVASLSSAIVSSALTGVRQIVEPASSLASVAAPTTVAPIPTPNQSSALSSLALTVSSNVPRATSAVSAASSKASAAVSNGSVLVASVVSGVTSSILVASSALPSGASILVDSASSGIVTQTVSSASTSVTHSGTTTASATRIVTSNTATTTVASGSSSTAAPNSAASGKFSGTMESCILILAAGMVSAFFVLS